jgi:hypothetical protein
VVPVVVLSALDQLGTIDLKPILISFGLTEAQASLAPEAWALRLLGEQREEGRHEAAARGRRGGRYGRGGRSS